MAPRRNIHPNESPSQNPKFSEPAKPTLALPSLRARAIPTGGLYSFFPETQFKSLKSSMRPRGGFVDSSLRHVESPDTGCVSPKLPQKNVSEIGSVHAASDSHAGSPVKHVLLPIPEKLPIEKREDKEQENQPGTDDGSRFDVLNDLGRIVDLQAIPVEPSDETPSDEGATTTITTTTTTGIEKRQIEPPNHAFYTPLYPFQSLNPSTNPAATATATAIAIDSAASSSAASAPQFVIQHPHPLAYLALFLPLICILALQILLLYHPRSCSRPARHPLTPNAKLPRDADAEAARWLVAETHGASDLSAPRTRTEKEENKTGPAAAPAPAPGAGGQDTAAADAADAAAAKAPV